jgi:hypothetical protein
MTTGREGSSRPIKLLNLVGVFEYVGPHSQKIFPQKNFSWLQILTILYAIAYHISQIVNSICKCMLKYENSSPIGSFFR